MIELLGGSRKTTPVKCLEQTWHNSNSCLLLKHMQATGICFHCSILLLKSPVALNFSLWILELSSAFYQRASLGTLDSILAKSPGWFHIPCLQLIE